MPTNERRAKISRMQQQRLPGLLVVLEDIADPHNAAAILRTCDGLGVGSVWYLFDTVEPYDPCLVGKRSSATANQWLAIETFTDRSHVQQHLVSTGWTSVAATIHEPAAEPLWQADFTARENLAIWVGNEQTGLSSAALQFCDRALTIPMQGMVESFNVSVATAIVLAEISRQRRIVD